MSVGYSIWFELESITGEFPDGGARALGRFTGFAIAESGMIIILFIILALIFKPLRNIKGFCIAATIVPLPSIVGSLT